MKHIKCSETIKSGSNTINSVMHERHFPGLVRELAREDSEDLKIYFVLQGSHLTHRPDMQIPDLRGLILEIYLDRHLTELAVGVQRLAHLIDRIIRERLRMNRVLT